MKRSKKQAAWVAKPGVVVAADADLSQPLLNALRSLRSGEHKSGRTRTLADVAETLIRDAERHHMILRLLEQRRQGGKPPSPAPPGKQQIEVDALTSVLLELLRGNTDVLR